MREMILGEAESRGFVEGITHTNPLTRPAFTSTRLLTAHGTKQVEGVCKWKSLSGYW